MANITNKNGLTSLLLSSDSQVASGKCLGFQSGRKRLAHTALGPAGGPAEHLIGAGSSCIAMALNVFMMHLLELPWMNG